MSKGDLEHLSDEEVRDVRNRVSQARGLLQSALFIIDGEGGEHRDHIAEAYEKLTWEDTALNGHVSMREGESE